ncbi:hypothetical protein SAMN05660772_02878 [Pasteurella testudinis DSM 23072]|uniref:Glycine zipper n=1 Tax=Pasteurella testudinis DSM 23072 TaxID=1122938 RepID=A0A1W1V7S1_9PAST|nr:hypothetical protein SAMN05660772_02878 [Pasteurella testudinis DSM 23072]
MDAKEVYESFKKDGHKVGENTTKTAIGVAGSSVGAAGGAYFGGLAGSVVPGFGTVIGGAAGAILGSLGGEAITEWGIDELYDK